MLRLKVEAIKWELPDTATFLLSEADGKPITYKAGQFITLIFDHHNEEIRRSYSLSSSPDEDLLAITVKRIVNGEISRFLLTKIKPGDIINAEAPAGRFILQDFADEKDIILFAAGSGITPILSQLKYTLKRPGKSRITLIYSSTDAESILFNGELNALTVSYSDRLTVIKLLSSDGKRLNNIIVEQLVKQAIKHDLTKAEFYLCGPFTYMRMIRLTLLYMGIEPAQIRKENFVLETISVTESAINFPPLTIRIKFKTETYDLVVGENQSILQAALQNGIQLPYSCRNGICSACTAMCKGGGVSMVKNDVLTDLDLSQGWVLTCTGHPVRGGVVISFL
ncbi:ring-1,2-phenylacetyl-CoA epoxidase subunit PaaE [Mucilaginibacter mallensis]|uniref:Ring-1,2-phenylacetyl-CoA epoxidase subunit PaaE n=1 Tax=Mucilaginibacter mallensis TaxID=652787 RepID=A0A1H2B0P3_MUCMA|nr:ferredoxin--NADP reductase [Mucilaginibacter mallensis]SDT51569.1 ring-1,2-phenylacetyl-CoA epoxidase subunit PaaE [Mucilaginibacter mallensis]